MYLTKRIIEHRLPTGDFLLTNTLSGAIDIIESRVWLELKNLDEKLKPGLKGDIVRRLIERGYLFRNTLAEKQYLARIKKLAARQARLIPTQYEFSLTYSCNMACRYCFEGPLTQSHMTMSSEDVTAALESVKTISSLAGTNYEYVLFGGEPLLPENEQLVRMVLDHAQKYDIKVQIVTNGFNLSFFSSMLRQYAQWVKHIQVTVDGPQEIHDARRPLRGSGSSYGEIMKGIDTVLHSGLPVCIRINADRSNLQQIPSMFDEVEDRGWSTLPNYSCYVYPVTSRHDSPSTDEIGEDELLVFLQETFRGQKSLLQVLEAAGFKALAHIGSVLDPDNLRLQCPPLDRYCEATAYGHWSFAPDGLIYPCSQSLGIREMAVGSYKPKVSLDMKKVHAWGRRTVFNLPECQDCAYALLCGGGCAFEAWRRHGEISTAHCGRTREVVHRYLAKMALLALNSPNRGEAVERKTL